MAVVYITEFIGINDGSPQQPPVAEQTVAVGGTSTQSSAFGSTTSLIRVHTDAVCSIAIGKNPTATTSKARMAANSTEYFAVSAGDKIAVISNT